MTKTQVIEVLQEAIESKINDLQLQLDEILQSMQNDTKSTAGDKHETSRAMAQIEQEKIGNQLAETLKLKNQLVSISSNPSNEKIRSGNLIETNNGFFFLGIPFGQLKIGSISVFCLSVVAPLGQLLLDKKVNDIILLNGKSIEIIAIY